LIGAEGKRVRKIRYYYPFEGRTAEIDVFQDELKGLILVDVEFENVNDKDSFGMPEFCLVDVTQEDFIAGGMICGKRYDDILEDLDGFGYIRLEME
jgi:CYTH domain-containing protein